jgi:hypothetical protein
VQGHTVGKESEAAASSSSRRSATSDRDRIMASWGGSRPK